MRCIARGEQKEYLDAGQRREGKNPHDVNDRDSSLLLAREKGRGREGEREELINSQALVFN